MAEEEHTARFRPRSQLISVLGEQLISDQAVGLIELVKNSYDADATEVDVRLLNLEEPEETVVEVSDNGCGMTLADVEEKWLSPAVNHKDRKKRKGERTELGRLPIGEKGVGRFASHQIGRKLEIVTRAEDEPEVYLFLDWDEFENQEFLSDIEVTLVERNPEVFIDGDTGTRLRITEARDKWKESLLKKVHRTFRRLQSPLNDGEKDFEIELHCPQYPQYENINPTDILEKSHYEFWAYVDEDGLCDFEYESHHPAVPDREEAGTENLCQIAKGDLQGDESQSGPFSMHLYVWDRSPQYLSKSGVSRDELDAHSGVSLFRDGLRVLPYGEPGDDWLFLDQERIQAPAERIGNNQVVGVVSVDQEDNLQLRDKTNREGLIENEAFQDLRALVRAAIRLFTTHWRQDRPNSSDSSDDSSDDAPEEAENGEEGSAEAIHHAQTLAETLRESADEELDIELPPAGAWKDVRNGDDDQMSTHTVSQRQAIELLIEQLTTAEDTLEERERRLDVLLHLAATGLSAERLVHEVGRQSQAALDAIGDLRPVVRRSEVGTEALDVIDSSLQALRNEFRVLAPYEAVSRSQRTRDVSTREAAETAKTLNRQDPDASGVNITVAGEDFEVRARPASVVQVLDNLVNNAIHWADSSDSGGAPRVGIVLDPERRRVMVADTGPGVQKSMQEQMFEPFVTLKPEGRGLGLFICRELMDDMDGQIRLLGEENREGVPDWATGAAFEVRFGSEG